MGGWRRPLAQLASRQPPTHAHARPLPCTPACRLLATVPEADMAQAQRVLEEIGRLSAEAEAEAAGAAARLDKLL